MEFNGVIIPANVSDTSITTTKETGFFTIEPEAPFSTVHIEEQLRKKNKMWKMVPEKLLRQQQRFMI